MKVNRKNSFFTAIVLSLILCCSFLITSFLPKNQELVVRDINVDEIGTLSYEEKTKQILSSFDNYNVSSDESKITFEGEIDMSSFDLTGFQFLSTSATNTTKKYMTKFDVETEKIYVTTQYLQEECVVFEETIEATPYYDEENNDYFIDMPSGEKISISETLLCDNLDECLTAEIVGTGVVVAFVAFAILVNDPTVIKNVTTVITQVITWVRSFFSWFFSLFTQKTTYQTSTVVTYVSTPSVTIQGTKYQTKELTKSNTDCLVQGCYYLCFADPTNGKMYISIFKIEFVIAQGIMYSPTLVPCIGNSNKDMIVSVFSLSQSAAYSLTCSVGIAKNTPEVHGTGYYYHYHSVYEKLTRQGDLARPHAFFLVFDI